MSDLFRLDGRVAVVTGGGGQLGREFARALVDAGAVVVLTGRDQARIEAVSRELGENAAAIPVEISDDDSVVDLFEQVERLHGGVDVLVNNAAVATDSPLGELTSAEFNRVLHVNVTGAALCTQSAAPSMRRRGGGKIVNVGSIYGTVAPDPRLYEGTEMVRASPPYVASKSALVNLTRDLGVRLAPWNIQVNMISPGGVEAEQPAAFEERYVARTPAGRMATPADLVGPLIYLCSAASDYVVGQDIRVDGGFTCW